MKTQSILILDNGWSEISNSNVTQYSVITVNLNDVDAIYLSQNNIMFIQMKSGRILMKKDTEQSEYFRIIIMWDNVLSYKREDNLNI